MSDLGPLFDGETLKRTGMERADNAEPVEWKDAADAAIAQLAASGVEFTADDIRAICGPPSRPNAVGSRFQAAARRGLIRMVGTRIATRPSLQSCLVRVWRGA
jgi:hypothetical protein